ncbi:beta-N-acetylhexosaminidase [Fodinicola acaciae]|uniref:beta-N-acetylhexosaminidase n=1 Tax=Fodinicola acaciae TaxID=2681555 RepID=UPI0013D75566|nr:beta-N-acetylhexosaminidase [Fodinicola acaciae]
MSRPTRRTILTAAAATALSLGLPTTPAEAAESAAELPKLIPAPASLKSLPGKDFQLTARSSIAVLPAYGQPLAAAEMLAGVLRQSTGFALPVNRPSSGPKIVLTLGGPASLGQEGYELTATAHAVLIRARTAEGLFRGITTLRQLLPAKVEASSHQPGPWAVPSVRIADHPRFGWRGAMLDVSRHFFPVAAVKRYLDLISLYKINVLHLHLADDQGWRIVVDSWPRLATYGGSTQVGGGAGGYYTKRDYQDLVAYAAARFITIVPEIDSPGHTNAALASYAELNCDGVAPPLYTGTDVGFSSLCVAKPLTYKFLDDVVREIAEITPGAFYHLGGDEAHSTPHDDYVTFVDKLQPIVKAHGKRVIGWDEIGAASLLPGSYAQHWDPATGNQPGTEKARNAVAKGAKLVMSPASRAYLDMKYNKQTPLGLSWAGYVEVKDSYDWDPATIVSGLQESDIAGVEAPLWSETLVKIADIEFMAFPRLPGIAELGWSPAASHGWDAYKLRLAAQAPRWSVLGVNYYRSTQVPWPS